MADQKISAATAVTTPGPTDEFPVNQGGNSKKMTLTQIASYLRAVISGATGTANQNGAGTETRQVLTADAAANSTVTIATVMTTNSLPAGTYRFVYEILAVAAATTTSVKFSVNFTGTITSIIYNLFFPSAGVTAATGVASQAANVTTGSVWAFASTRTNNTVLGPFTDHDTTGIVRYRIEGILVCTTAGNMTLGHASEVAASTTVKAGTMLFLERLN